MTKIAVLGSCVSRDGFNSQFIPDYKNYYKCVLHQNQMSMISLVSSKINFQEDLIDSLKPFDAKQFRSELDKSFLDNLKKEKPDYIIIDFYGDIYYGAQEIGESWITNKKWLFSKTSQYEKLYKKRSLSLQYHYDEYLDLWKSSVDVFFNFLSKELPHCKVILNKARFIDDYRNETTGKIEKISETGRHRKINVGYYNRLWNTLDEYITSNFQVKVLEYNYNSYISIESHPWGMFYVHYDQSYYTDFTAQLLGIIIEDVDHSKGNLVKKLKEVKEVKSGSKIVCNFKDKISKSGFNNPNYTAYRKNLKELGNPKTDFNGESLTGTYSTISVKDGHKATVQTSEEGAIAQRLFRFNILKEYEKGSSDNKSKKLKLNNIRKLTLSWWGEASGSEGNYVEMALWNEKESKWESLNGDMIHKIEVNISKFIWKFNHQVELNNYIDDSGNMNFLAYSSPASKNKNAKVETDYIELTFDVKRDIINIKKILFN